jgi:hypothetical protein
LIVEEESDRVFRRSAALNFIGTIGVAAIVVLAGTLIK